MIRRIAKTVVGPALFWAVLMGSAFIGIGGMSIEGAGASDAGIRALWQGGGMLTGLAFLLAMIVFGIRGKPADEV